MFGFFVKHKKIKGAITIFMTIVYLAVYILISVLVDGGRIRMAETVIEDVQQIATENVMSQYNRGLYEHYGLFGTSGYDEETIAKEVQKQVEESIGLKFDLDVIKTFVRDTNTAAKSLYDRIIELKNKDESEKKGIIETVVEEGKGIQNDIQLSKTFFDPYGLECLPATVSYIDLTDKEVFRAQIRDNTRYTMPFILGANFFDVIEEFMAVSSAASDVNNITSVIQDAEDSVNASQVMYKASLDQFCKNYKELIKASYESSEDKSFSSEKLVKAATSLLNSLSSLFSSFISGFSSTEGSDELDNKPLDLDFNQGLGENGSTDLIAEDLVFDRFIKEFDNSDRWIDASPHNHPYWELEVVGHDEYGEPIYEWRWQGDSLFWGDVSDAADDAYKDFISSVDKIKTILDRTIDGSEEDVEKPKSEAEKDPDPRVRRTESNTKIEKEHIGGIDETIGYLDNLLSAIEDALKIFNDNYDANDKANNKKSKTIYAQNIETYLRTWARLKKEKEVLLEFQAELHNITGKDGAKENLEAIVACAASVSDDIGRHHQYEYRGDQPTKRMADDSSLKNKISAYKSNIDEIEDKNISTLQHDAKSENLQNSVLDTLKEAIKTKDEKKNEITKNDDNSIYKKEMKIHGDTLSEDQLNNPKKDFDSKNLISTVKNIMSTLQKFIDNLPSELVKNPYDIAYIMYNCRDYVHTYRYNTLDETLKNDPDIDSILNPKFIKSDEKKPSEYLTGNEYYDKMITPAEIEYIIWGDPDTKKDVSTMYTNIFIIRLGMNYIAALTSKISSMEIRTLASAGGPFAPVIYAAAPLIYAIPKSIFELDDIMEKCKKVNVFNGSNKLTLFSAFGDEAIDLANDLRDKTKEIATSAKDLGKNSFDTIDTRKLINEVERLLSIDANAAVEDSCSYLNKAINEEIITCIKESDMDKLGEVVDDTIDEVFDEVVDKISDSSGNVVDATKPKLKAGYSDYLLLYLLITGLADKNNQISRLQDVVETNMQEYQEDFALNKSYAQIAVEGEYDVKFIFMTQSFLPQSYKSKIGRNSHTFKIRTASAY